MNPVSALSFKTFRSGLRGTTRNWAAGAECAVGGNAGVEGTLCPKSDDLHQYLRSESNRTASKSVQPP